MSSVKQLNIHQILVGLTTHSTEAILYIHYEQVDEKNHKSLLALVNYLSEAGETQVAELLHHHSHYLIFSKQVEALRVYHLINGHSVAINATLVFAGLENEQAENKIKELFYPKPTHIKFSS